MHIKTKNALLVVTTTVLLSACGFKSDLFLPGESDSDELFAPDTAPQVQTDPILQRPSSALPSDEIVIEKLDGTIVEIPEVEIPPTLDTASSIAVPAAGSSDGVALDISGLTDELEKDTNAQ